jgi:hypothetical protein
MYTLLCKVEVILDVPETGNQAVCSGDENKRLLARKKYNLLVRRTRSETPL